MDRAHRLGQKRTVNVYRLLTRGTLEEKVMGMQQFKLDVANAVVNADNMSFAEMDTGQLLDLFAVQKGAPQVANLTLYISHNICPLASGLCSRFHSNGSPKRPCLTMLARTEGQPHLAGLRGSEQNV